MLYVNRMRCSHTRQYTDIGLGYHKKLVEQIGLTEVNIKANRNIYWVVLRKRDHKRFVDGVHPLSHRTYGSQWTFLCMCRLCRQAICPTKPYRLRQLRCHTYQSLATSMSLSLPKYMRSDKKFEKQLLLFSPRS